jgi:hypothetical protein
MLVKCKRCNRRVKYPVYVNGLPYGSSCAKKVEVQDVSSLRKEVTELKILVTTLQKALQEKDLSYNPDAAMWNNHTPLMTVPNGSSAPISYGEDHAELMNELNSVLADRRVN